MAIKIIGVYPHNGKLRISFDWAEESGTKPIRQRVSTGLVDTSENRLEAHFLRKQIKELIDKNEFNSDRYCTLLPNSSYAKKQIKLVQNNELSYLDAVKLYIEYYNELTEQGLKSPTSREADNKILTGDTATILKKMSLQKIQRKHIHAMQRQWEALRPDGTKTKNKTTNNKISAFKAMFKYLRTKLEILKDDVTDAFERRSVEHKSPKVFSAILMSAMYQDLYVYEGPEYANLYATICLFGLRVGEACALSEEDIDFIDSKTRINRALVTDRQELTDIERQTYIDKGKKPPKKIGRTYWKGTKTGKERILDSSDVIKDIFREQRLLNRNLPSVTTIVHRGGNIEHETFKPLFVHHVRGKGKIDVFSSKAAQGAYDRSKKRLGLSDGETPPIKDGRSTKASVIASTTGNAFQIQAQLGHSDIQTLQRHYAKYFESHEKMDLEYIFSAARSEVVPKLLSVVKKAS